MAKSTRSKVKRAYRAKKRESGVYAAAEAARLQKLNAKLAHIISSDIGKDLVVVEEPGKAVPGLFYSHIFALLDSSVVTPELVHLYLKIDHSDDLSFLILGIMVMLTFFLQPEIRVERKCRQVRCRYSAVSLQCLIILSADLMPIDTPRISTHGPRNSRREEWRKSKGMPARRVHKGTTWVAMSKRRRR
jgi:hypothetical protein